MPGMNSGLSNNNSTIVAAFRSALLHQGILVLAVFAVLALAWLVVREWGRPALTRAGIVHLHFVCIHPFEDGNGRIGRALAEKSLAQNRGQPSLIALSYTIERRRKDYYAALERSNKENEITEWLTYFADTVLEAQNNTTLGFPMMVAILFAAAVLVSTIGSGITLRRFLKV